MMRDVDLFDDLISVIFVNLMDCFKIVDCLIIYDVIFFLCLLFILFCY